MRACKTLSRRRWRRQIGECNAVHSFPVVSRHHFNCVPGTAIKKCAIRSFADAFLAANAEIGIDLDATKWRVIFVGYPKHAGFDRAILDAGRRTRTTCAAVGRDGKYARLLFASCFAVTYRHGPMFFYDVEHRAVVRIQKSEFRSRIKRNNRKIQGPVQRLILTPVF